MSRIAVVILSCSKSQYAARREAQLETIQKLARIPNVNIFYLFHSPAIETPTIQPRDEWSDFLYTPIPEDYESIPLRLWSAYTFLADKGYSHILKMDDDIQLLPSIGSTHMSQILEVLYRERYVALKGVGGREIPEKEGTIISNSYHWGKCTNPLLNKTYSIFPSVDYASGPCYWISTDSIQRMKQTDFEKCIFEDVCLGIACKKYGIPLGNAVELFRNIIKGDDSPWPYTQYILKNYSMYNDMINS